MSKKAFPLLTGGLNEVTRPDLIEDNELQVCTNYEIIGDGILRRRKYIAGYELSPIDAEINLDPDIYDKQIERNPNDFIFLDAEYISEPYYPEKLFEGQVNDFILFAYGNKQLHGYWKNEDGWTNEFGGDTLNTILSNSGITYTADSDVQIVIGSDKVIITDGVNPVHFISVDNEGELRAGIMGIPAPKNKAQVTEMTEWQSDLWETDSTASRLSTPGLFQCIYTVVTKYGEESNPSPLSDTLDMQFFKLDEDGIDAQWLEKVEIKGLNIPDVPDNVKDSLKYFKVYFRVIKYSEGAGTKALEFSQQFEIAEKTTDAKDTGNNYTLTVAVSPGEIASYENDVAPIAKTAAEIGGITMAGNVRTKIKFPFNFKYYHKITINNKDSKSYVDAVIRLRLKESEIENFDISDFVRSDKTLKNSEYIRLYDNDMTTPLMVAYNGYNDDGYTSEEDYIDLFIKIPLLTAASTKTIYLCWTPESETDYDGVDSDYNELNFPDAGEYFDSYFIQGELYEFFSETSGWNNNIGIHYGRFMVIKHFGWLRQEVWSGRRVVNSFNTIFADFEVGYINKAGESDDDLITGTSIESSFFKMPITGKYLPGSHYVSINDNDNRVEFKPPSYIDSPCPDKGMMSFYYKIGNTSVPKSIISIFNKYLSYYPEDNAFAGVGVGASVSPPDSDSGHFIVFSWEGDSKRSLFAISLETGEMNKMEMTDFISDDTSTFTSLTIGKIDNSKYDNVFYQYGRYLSADSSDDIAAITNMANLMPAFDNMIGYKYSDTSHNNNIIFDETEEIEYKEFRNMVKWTDVNYQSFADLFYKKVREPILKIMPAPSFLQFEYQNTFIIFTRNSINRFVLEGSADGWSGSSSSLIEEKTQYGLLAEKSLVRAGDALFWLSEVGVVMWGKDGMRLISKNVVNVPIDDSLIGFYAPLNNQYIIHDNTGNTSYVFHIDRGIWSKFTGFDIVSVATMTAGSRYDNINLLLNSDGVLKKYPIDSYTTEDSEIQTKDMFFEKGTLRRMKADFVQGSSAVTMKSIMTTRKADGTEKVNTNSITNPNSGQWRGTSLENSRGEKVSFGIKNADEIKHIMYDLKVEE